MRRIVLLIVLFTIGFAVKAQPERAGHREAVAEQEAASKGFDLVETLMHHIADSYEWHLWGQGEEAVYIPLPVILVDGGLKVFSSAAFHQGRGVVEKGGRYYVCHGHEIYRSDAAGTIDRDAEGHPTNPRPLDLSITKNVAAMLIALVVLLIAFSAMARAYSKKKVPKGLTAFVEPIVLFIRDDIAIPNIGAKQYKPFLPYLLTLFFFIWVCNLLGLLPASANVSGNIAVTLSLASIALIAILFSANKAYWRHIFWMPGVPVPFKIILAPIEVLGIFTKPFALMIRLFANMTGGHIVVLSLVSLIFIFKSLWVSPVSVLLGGFIVVLEFLVALLQAYVFTILTAVFIGLAVQEEHR